MKQGTCQDCNKQGVVHIHHRDGNHSNDVPDNRVPLCASCHRMAHSVLGIGTNRREEYLPIDWEPEPVPWAEVRRQYYDCFPRL